MILEACVGNTDAACMAATRGAHQVELCDRLDLDGTSPPLEVVLRTVQRCPVPVKVIINPHSYRYHYDHRDLDDILRYIGQVEQIGIQGIVFGPVDGEGMPDYAALERIRHSTDLPMTYHKAIDAAPDMMAAMRGLAEQGVVDYVLTSGGHPTAMKGLKRLCQLRDLIWELGTPVSMIAAGGITDQNLTEIHETLGISYYHGKAIVGDLSQ